MSEYYIFITDAGAALETAAHTSGESLVLTAFGVCDGGSAFTPDPTLTTLENEVYRGEISSLSVSPDDNSVLVAQCIVPASSGGYTIRGIGLYAGDTLYAVGNYPDQPKPAPDSGYAASLEILAQLAVSDTADVTLNVTDGAWLTKEEGDQLYVPLARKVNGHALTDDVNVTAQDIFSGQAVGIGDAADLNSYTTPGLYYQPVNAQATAGKNYPETVAGSLEVYKHAGITQIYRVYNSSRSYIRTLYGGTWSAWTKQYDAANKPTAGDVDAVSASNGGTFQKEVGFNGGLWVRSKTGMYSGDDAAGFSSNNMLLKSWYGIGFYCTLTDANQKETGLTGYINTRTGRLEMKEQIIPGSYVNFDSRYYTKTQSDAAYMPKTGAYTKTESDSRYQAKGNYTPAGTAYTKAESDARYNLKNTATKSANAMTSKDASTGVMEVVMSNITVAANTNVSITFSTAFPSVCVGVVIAYDGTGHGNDSDSSIAVSSYSRTGCVLHAYNANGKFMLIAKGY